LPPASITVDPSRFEQRSLLKLRNRLSGLRKASDALFVCEANQDQRSVPGNYGTHLQDRSCIHGSAQMTHMHPVVLQGKMDP
jgi:hypothetical protein